MMTEVEEKAAHVPLQKEPSCPIDAPPPYQPQDTAPLCPQKSFQVGFYPKQPGAPATPAPILGDGLNEEMRYADSTLKHMRYIPVYPFAVTIILMIINCIIPGLGCWIGIPLLLCGHSAVKEDCKGSYVCINFGAGFVSILTLAFGIGYWIAIAWSMATIMANRMYYQRPIAESEIIPAPTPSQAMQRAAQASAARQTQPV